MGILHGSCMNHKIWGNKGGYKNAKGLEKENRNYFALSNHSP